MSMHKGPRQGHWRHAKVLEERDPSLINLPLPLPSIPLLTPLLSPLISGSEPDPPEPAPSSSSKSSPTPTSTTPQASPTPTNVSGSSSGNGGSSGGGTGSGNPGGGGGGNSGTDSSISGSGNSGGNNAGSGTGGSSSGNSGSDSGSSPSSGSSGSTDSNGDGGSNSSGQSPPSSDTSLGSSSGSGANSGSSWKPSGSEGSGSSGGGSAAVAGASSSQSAAGTAQSAGSSGSGNNSTSSPAGPGNALINAQAAPDIDSSSAAGAAAGATPASTYTGVYVSVVSGNSGTTAVLYSHGVPISTAMGSIDHSSGSPWATITNPFGPQAATPSSTSGADSGSSVHHGVAAGVIAAIAIVALALCSLLICCAVRRRSISKRLKARSNWMFGGQRDTAGRTGGISNASYFAAHPNSDRSSIRSSGSSFFNDPPEPTPALEQLSSMHPVTTNSTSPSPSIQTAATNVWPSNLSGSVCAPPAAATLNSTPYPTIRSPDRRSTSSTDSDASSTHSALALYPVLPPQIATNVSPLKDYAASTPMSPIMSVRPFSPTESWSFPKPPALSGGDASVHTFGALMGPYNEDSDDGHSAASHDANPFADPFADGVSDSTHGAESADPETATHFAAIEVVCRAFAPGHADEMAVAPGLRVRMLRRYSDGWALAEAVESGVRGLIPIDCLRDVQQDLPAFLAEKRLGEYPAVPGLLNA